MLKNLLINNFTALLIHIIIVVLTWLQYVTIGKGQSPGPVWGPILALGALALYVAAGFLLAGKILLKHELILVNFLSVSIIAILGVILWLYCATHPTSLVPGMQWLIFCIGFPYCEPFHFGGPASFMIAMAPSVLIGFGMMIKGVI